MQESSKSATSVASAPRDALEIDNSILNEADDYLRFKKLEKQLGHLDVMEEYIKLETRNLEKELLHAQEEVGAPGRLTLWSR